MFCVFRSGGLCLEESPEISQQMISHYISLLAMPSPSKYPPPLKPWSLLLGESVSSLSWRGIPAMTISKGDGSAFRAGVNRGGGILRISLLDCGWCCSVPVSEAERILCSRWAIVTLPFRTEPFRIWGKGVEEQLPQVNQGILLRKTILIALPFTRAWKQ